MYRLLAVVIFIVGICVVQSCDKAERTLLTSEEQDIVDSLYSAGVSAVRKEADSICKAQYQTIFDAAADSFYQEEVRMIQSIINGEG